MAVPEGVTIYLTLFKAKFYSLEKKFLPRIKNRTNQILLSSGKGSLDLINNERACSPEIKKKYVFRFVVVCGHCPLI